jgi:hypothetical protein
MSCVSYKRSWKTEQGKVTKIGCEKGQRNANKEKEVATEQESMKAKARRPYLAYIYGMNTIVKGFPLVFRFGLLFLLLLLLLIGRV